MNNTNEEYDAIVVGSGCTGGTAAMVLSERGLKVLVIEAGKNITPEMSTTNPSSNFSKLHRFWRGFISKTQEVQSTHPGYWTSHPDLFVNDKENPYSSPKDKKFLWLRGRQVGGRSHTWGGVASRWSKYEFKIPERDGYGKWPLSYEELAPHYEKVERAIRVKGTCYNLPNYPDGIFEPGPKLTPAEEAFNQKLEIAWPGRKLLLSRGMSQKPNDNGNPWSAKSSLGTTLAIALATGRVTILPRMAVRHVEFDSETKKATGVCAIDGTTHEERKFKSRIVVLCAGTIESVRILLNSAGPIHTDGPGNQAGLLGRCIMDHLTTSRHLLFPWDGKDYATVYPTGGENTVWIPRWLNLEKRDCNFLGGLGVWGGIQRGFQPTIREGWVSGMLSVLAEMMPNPENRVELDKDQVDAWGIPTVKISCKHFENDLLIKQHSEKIVDELLELSGSKVRNINSINPIAKIAMKRIKKERRHPGWYIHEVGGAMMGSSPENSVVNSFCQIWGAPNLLVTDGACWPTQGWQSPTLTMMAITSRACSHIADEMQRKNI